MSRPKSEGDEKINSVYRAFIEHQNFCPLCNSQLTIRVETELDSHFLREEATCPNCQLLARIKEHTMH